MMDLPARLEPVLAGLGYELVTLERAGPWAGPVIHRQAGRYHD